VARGLPVRRCGEGRLPGALLCRVLGVFRSSFYAWLEAEDARQIGTRADDALAREITVIHLASKSAYGVPRVRAELRRLGRPASRKRVERVMRERQIAGVTRRRRRSLPRPDKQAGPSPNLIGRDFTAARPGTRLVGGITYPPRHDGWLYLACWLDLATREVIGYVMADHCVPHTRWCLQVSESQGGAAAALPARAAIRGLCARV